MIKNINISVIVLGYVGLPLAIEFGKYFNTIGFDISKIKINNLKQGNDLNNEISQHQIKNSKYLLFSNNQNDLTKSNIKIIAVPTPVKKNNKPDLKILLNACKLASKFIKKNDLIIFESTVFPGATEDYCIPEIEKFSKLKWKKDFNVGYSPERINPGDQIHTITKIKKLISADCQSSLKKINFLYNKIIKAGVFKCDSIKVAEAAKVIENSQRDINIAFINELQIIFDNLNIDINSVLKAASTKWNFLNFKPGLVGGHCIGVDPYYLSYISEKNNYLPKLILSGRNINNNMGEYFTKQSIKFFKKNFKNKKLKKILILGFTFKENCSDFRNTRVVDICLYLKDKNIDHYIYDPNINLKNAKNLYNLNFIKYPKINYYDMVIIAVAHKIFIKIGKTKIQSFIKNKQAIFDIKNVL